MWETLPWTSKHRNLPGRGALPHSGIDWRLKKLWQSMILIIGLAILPSCLSSSEKTMKTLPKKTETTILAGGCFWGMQDILRKIPGILYTEVGYTGGQTKNPRYEDVKTGKTGHAEAVRVEFDPEKIGFEKVLSYFFRMHDPTTVNRQGNDIGTQYRSAIFTLSETQKQIAEQKKQEIEKSKKWPRPVATEIIEASTFYPAEEYHQDYLEKNPGGYTCHFLRD